MSPATPSPPPGRLKGVRPWRRPEAVVRVYLKCWSNPEDPDSVVYRGSNLLTALWMIWNMRNEVVRLSLEWTP